MLFDLAWSEIALIGVVAVVVIGPKELPNAIKGIASGIQKAKKSLREFQSQADELVREANLTDVRDKIHEVRNTISDIRRFDLKGMVEKTVDGDGTIRGAMDGLSGNTTPAWTPPATAATTAGAPDFIPPATLAPYIPPPPPATAATTEGAPDFLPPATLTPAELLAPKEEPKAEELPAEDPPAVIPPEATAPDATTPAEPRPANNQA